MNIDRFLSGKTAVAASALLATLCLTQSWNAGQSCSGLDYYQFYSVGREALSRKGESVYSDEFRARFGQESSRRAAQSPDLRLRAAAEERTQLETYSTPFLYALFGSLSSGNYDRSYSLYQLVCLLCMTAAILVLGQLMGFPLALSILFLAVIVSTFEGYLSDVRVANVNQLQLAALTLLLWRLARAKTKADDFLSGAILGALILFKPNTLFIAVLLGVSRLVNQRRGKLAWEAAGALFAAAAAVSLSSTAFGSSAGWGDWLGAASSIPASIAPLSLGNFSLSRIAGDAWGASFSRVLMAGLTGISAYFIWLGARKKRDRTPQDAPVIAAGCLIYLLSAPLVWLHYFVLALPALMFILRPLPKRVNHYGLGTRKVLGLSAAIMLLSISSMTSFSGAPALYLAAGTTMAATAVLFVLTLLELGGSDLLT